MKPLYRRIADELAISIERSVYSPGDRLPSVRETGQRYKVCVPTVMQAYVDLEAQGLIESKPRSGFYVSQHRSLRLIHSLSPVPTIREPLSLQLSGMVRWFYDAARFKEDCPLGISDPSVELYPIEKFNRTLSSICRSPARATEESRDLRGDVGLRIEVSRRALSWGCIVSPDDVIITTGSTEALKICLEAVTKPGEIVAVESPTYVGILLAIEALHLHVVEIPSHPRDGMDLESFALTASHQRISALVIVPNFANPTGSRMPDTTKRRLVELCESKGIPIIEDDAIGDLSYGCARPLALKAFDQCGNVLLCGSLSKTLSPYIRLGWALPGMFQNRVLDAKFCTTTWGVSFSELAAAKFLRHGSFERHLRRLRAAFRDQVAQMIDTVSKHFPSTACIHPPQGGFFVWVKLPSCVDAMELHMAAHQRRVSIAPGPMFSASGELRNYIRLNAGHIWCPQIEAGIKVLGRLIKERV